MTTPHAPMHPPMHPPMHAPTHAPTDTPTYAASLALLRLFLARALPQLRTFSVVSVGLVILFSSKEGFRLDALLQSATVCAVAFVIHPSGFAHRAARDGTLRYLGTLPLLPNQHAACWIALCALHTLPIALLLPAVMALPPLNLPLIQLPGVVMATLLLGTAISAGILTWQLRVKGGSGPTLLVAIIGVILGGTTSVSWLLDLAPRLTALPRTLSTLVAGTALVGAILSLVVLRVSWPLLGQFMAFAWAEAPEAGPGSSAG